MTSTSSQDARYLAKLLDTNLTYTLMEGILPLVQVSWMSKYSCLKHATEPRYLCTVQLALQQHDAYCFGLMRSHGRDWHTL